MSTPYFLTYFTYFLCLLHLLNYLLTYLLIHSLRPLCFTAQIFVKLSEVSCLRHTFLLTLLTPSAYFTYLITYLLTHSLTPSSTVLLENLTGSQLVKKFPEFHGTRRYITAFTSAHHMFLACVRLSY